MLSLCTQTAELQILADAAEQKKRQNEGESEQPPEEAQTADEEERVRTTGANDEGQDLQEEETLNDESSEVCFCFHILHIV